MSRGSSAARSRNKKRIGVSSIDTYPCPLYGHASMDQTRCQKLSKVYSKNVNHENGCCKQKCQSPWRLCPACILQGYFGEDAVSVDYATGLCELHNKNGVDAERERVRGKPKPYPQSSRVGTPREEETTANEEKPQPLQANKNRGDEGHVEVKIKEARAFPVKRIRPQKDQPREWFDEGAIEHLSTSQERVGQIIPILVREVEGDPDHDYEIIEGERRWRSALRRDEEQIFGLVIEVDDPEHQFEISVAANFCREGHTALEKASAADRLRANGRTHAEIAEIFGCHQVTVSNYLKLLRLCPEVQKMMHPSIPDDKRLKDSAALALADYHPEEQVRMADYIVNKKMRTNQARAFVRNESRGPGQNLPTRKRNPDKDFRMLYNFLERTERDGDIFLGMTQKHIEGMFTFRASEDLGKAIASFGRVIDDLSELHEVLKEIQKKNKG